jgi:carboxylesterase type B
LKVFPETSRIPIFAYLGVPYAQPPVADLRFAPAQPMNSWNRTLIAREFKPICPQMEENVYEETADGYTGRRLVDEDCLYLNIWSPETAFRYGSFPVLVIVTGEEYAFDWLNRPSGLDLASESVVVVTVQYRMNIFGWLTLESEQAPGNLGLRDQQLAISWIKDNIGKFGGDPSKITLLGHGTSGAATATLQMMLPRSKNKLTKVILMGGTLLSPFSPSLKGKTEHPSTRLVQILACGGGNKRYIIRCLRQKSVSDLLRAYETIYQNGNSSWILGPIVDTYMAPDKRCFPDDFNLEDKMRELLEKPLMMGITSNEAAFMKGEKKAL